MMAKFKRPFTGERLEVEILEENFQVANCDLGNDYDLAVMPDGDFIILAKWKQGLRDTEGLNDTHFESAFNNMWRSKDEKEGR